MNSTFRKFLGQGSQEGSSDEDADLFRRSRRRSSTDDDEREDAVDYEPESRIRNSEEVEEDEQVIDVKKSGKELLFHNMIAAGISGAARQVEKFFRRLIQR